MNNILILHAHLRFSTCECKKCVNLMFITGNRNMGYKALQPGDILQIAYAD